jgi:hypothetical protein
MLRRVLDGSIKGTKATIRKEAGGRGLTISERTCHKVDVGGFLGSEGFKCS